MARGIIRGFIILLSVCCIVSANSETINNDLVIKNVERSIDLQSQLTKIVNKLTVENTGKNPVKSLLFAIEQKHKDGLSYIAAQTRDTSRSALKISETKVQNHPDKLFYKIELKDALSPGRSLAIEVETVSSNELVPHPKEITQKEKQLVRYFGNVYFYSPYTVAKQTSVITLPSRNVENYTKFKPVVQSDSTITYGPYEKVAPFSVEDLILHFENNNKFLTIKKLERVIEISHWGNIAIEETIDLYHTGALLKGSFSRYEYARESKSGQSSVQNFNTILPAAASDVYYRDEIGNISTSHMRIRKDAVELNLRPRFPLFGGWKTHYVIGYNVPSYEYLFNSGDEYLLRMRLLDHVFDDMVVEELVTKIILPEGSHSVKLNAPYSVTRLPDTLHYTYLDTKGRPVITITKNNLVENHIQDFQLRYTFPRLLMLQEPLLVVIALYLLFLLVIVYVRLDFSINKDEVSESKLRIAGRCEKILAAQDRRVNSYNDLDDQLSELKANKNTNTFQAAVKSINQEYKTATNTISELSLKLKGESGDVYERIQELQKLDKALKELYNQQQALYFDKLIPGRIGRQPFVDAESVIIKKKEETVEKINSIVKSLQ
ncbi:dolichyl-diphosphooligosaccharide--protein glycosyltransferase subunit 1 [Neodiprion pinetum]|uniref:Dolichyl-diphosphooligosaccharide--protein glycosyltransferase subunit 1 n=1 Tax=Neodiprion lecontei TaxID=441921 RepID=A0A6J0BHY5_NEOLC|nr:dolichyl-diphosphooligosaccharide--protein glycosyltransferase subunit 1 [Neodiprion lecontei]XP_046477013.1 dolichyl-diphosphooligosaccharide--protein glycosyltransferase subunit 1 [Neodiprion pinetum]